MNKLILCFISAFILISSTVYGGEIHDAIKNNDVKRVRAILNDNTNLLENYSLEGFTPLHVAVFHGRYEIVEELLIKKKANAQALIHGNKYEGWNAYHLLALKVREMPAFNKISVLLDMCGCDYNTTVIVNGKNLYPWDIAKITRNRTACMLFELDHIMSTFLPEKQPKFTITDTEVDAQAVKDAKKMLKSLFGLEK